jgi:hypothetical protein
LGKELAQQGFACISPEQAKSLAASYPRLEGLDRSTVNQVLLQRLEQHKA